MSEQIAEMANIFFDASRSREVKLRFFFAVMSLFTRKFAEAQRQQMSFGLLIYLDATRSGEGTAISRRPKSFL